MPWKMPTTVNDKLPVGIQSVVLFGYSLGSAEAISTPVAWKILTEEEPQGHESMGSPRVTHWNDLTLLSLPWTRKVVFPLQWALPENPMWPWWATASSRSRHELDTTQLTSSSRFQNPIVQMYPRSPIFSCYEYKVW